MKKKVLAVILTAVCTMGLMAGCGNSNVGNTNTQKNASSAEDGYKIGISQFAEHGSLASFAEPDPIRLCKLPEYLHSWQSCKHSVHTVLQLHRSDPLLRI